MEQQKLNKLREKYDEIIKNHVILRFAGTHYNSQLVVTSNFYILNTISDSFVESPISEGTIDIIIDSTQYHDCVYYICPPEYKDMMINNSSITKEIVKKKFKDNTLNKLYEEINSEE